MIIKTMMFLLLILGGSGLCLSDNKARAADWYSPDWEYRKVITVDNTSSADALTDYQVLVTLNADNFDYTKANANGSDLRFTDSDKLTEISYWIKEWNTEGDSKIWVKVPSIPAESTATIYLYYGNASATTSLSSFDDTMQKLEADADTAGLWHFDEGEGTTLGDSSINANDGVLNNFAADGIDWVADSASEYDGSGGALNFDGVDNYIEVLDSPSLNFVDEDFSIEAWIYSNYRNGTVIAKYITGRGYVLDINDWQTNLGLETSDGEDFLDSYSNLIQSGQWQHIAVVRDNIDLIKFYINGEEKTFSIEINGNVNDLYNEGVNLKIGMGGYTLPFNGLIDELRISRRALSAEEIKANYERRQYAAIEPISSLGAEETDPYDASETVVAANGGTVTNTADTAEVTIPANALSGDTNITIETNEETGSFQVQGAEPVDYIYNFGPEGTEFSSPVTLTFNYDDTGMTLEEENSLDIYYYNTGTSLWESQGATVNTNINTLSISVDHFSSFVIAKDLVLLGKLSKISKLLFSINDYSEGGQIENSGYFLIAHLKRVQRLIAGGDKEKAITVLGKFIEKVERFTPSKINVDASAVIIDETVEIIDLL